MFTAFWWCGIIWCKNRATSLSEPCTLAVIPLIMAQFMESIHLEN